MAETLTSPVQPRETEALVRAFHAPLRDFVAKRVAADEVDDLLQEIFLRVAAHPDALSHVGHVSGWLHRIARNAIVDLYRARHRADGRTSAADPDALEAGGDAGEKGGRALAQCLVPIVERLDEPYRTAVRLTDLEGLTQGEAARREGISLSGMKSRVQRGREQLRALVLACCRVELDRRHAVTDFESKRADCACRPRS
jgi:RNA polymerase sigma-70 factor (ECF subfamily)